MFTRTGQVVTDRRNQLLEPGSKGGREQGRRNTKTGSKHITEHFSAKLRKVEKYTRKYIAVISHIY